MKIILNCTGYLSSVNPHIYSLSMKEKSTFPPTWVQAVQRKMRRAGYKIFNQLSQRRPSYDQLSVPFRNVWHFLCKCDKHYFVNSSTCLAMTFGMFNMKFHQQQNVLVVSIYHRTFNYRFLDISTFWKHNTFWFQTFYHRKQVQFCPYINIIIH